MSSKDDPFGPNGRTVIKPARGPGQRKDIDPSRPSSPKRKADPTVIAPEPGRLRGKSEPAFRTVLADEQRPAQPSGGNRTLSFDQLLEAGHRVEFVVGNPLLAAAAPILVLLGHLRQMPIEIEPGRLADHVATMMQEFDRKVAQAGVGEADGRIALYILCETVDDIVPNLPGLTASEWLAQGMLSRFFHANAAGVGFFDALNWLLGDPEHKLDLLELIYTCLSLGFEGQYRRAPEGATGLDRVRRDVYETLSYFRPQPDSGISPQWRGVATPMTKPGGRIPVWAAVAAACALVAGGFFEMRRLVTEDAETLAGTILALDPSQTVAIQHVLSAPAVAAEPAAVAEPPPVIESLPSEDVQLERVRANLKAEIAAGTLAVDVRAEFIVVVISNLQLFQPGSATFKSEFDALINPIAATLSAESGPIRIVGHTDSDRPGRSSVFKSNFDLSVARARAVEKLLSPRVANADRIQVEGKGEDEPIADNATQEGRAKNRRVELMIAREDAR